MADNIIYKGSKVGTQVDFSTGNLTDISTFTGDVRGVAIQDQIVDGVTTIGASQDAIHAMSGHLAANSHPTVTPASDVSIDNSNGTVLQDATFTFDSDGHVTAASFNEVDLDSRYFTESEVTVISGVLNTKIGENIADIATNTGNIAANTANIATNTASIATNTGDIAANTASIATNTASIATNTGNIAANTASIATNNTSISALNNATGHLGDEIDALQAVSGSFQTLNLDDVCDNGAVTNQTITAAGLRVTGDGSSASITGPATIVIDPDSAGPAGTVVIAGDLQVDGTTTTINSTSVQIDDLSLVLGTGVPNAAAADGGGIIIDGTGVANVAEFTFDGTNNRWTTNNIDIDADIVGNASTASAWIANSTITLGGDLAGSVEFNAGSDETLTATIGAGVVENTMLENTSVSITGGAGLVGGGDAELGGSAVSLSVGDGAGITVNADDIAVNVDDTTIEISSDALRVKGNSIGTTQLAADSVTSEELHSSVAGENITFNDGELQVLDTDIRAAVFPSSSTLTPDRALVSDSNGKVSVSSTISTTELGHLNNVGSNIQTQLDGKALKTTSFLGSDGLTGGGTLAESRNFSTIADQGHLNEIQLGGSSEGISSVITKGGVLIVRATAENGLTLTGTADGNIIDLDPKTTVVFDGIIQSSDIGEAGDDGLYNAMWKVQGLIRRDNNNVTSLVQSFVTTVHLGSSVSDQKLSVSVDGAGLKIKVSDSVTPLDSDNIIAGTINYSWSQDNTA